MPISSNSINLSNGLTPGLPLQKPGKKSETGLDDLFHCDVRVCQRDLDGCLLESVLCPGKAEEAPGSSATPATDNAAGRKTARPACCRPALRVRPQTASFGVACRSLGMTQACSALVPDAALLPASMEAYIPVGELSPACFRQAGMTTKR